MNSSFQSITIRCDHWSQMLADIKSRLTEEACGFVLGIGNLSMLVIPVTNSLHSRTKFFMEPKEQLDAYLLAEDKGLDILAVYHSHPNGIDTPSVTDFEELTFPGVIYLIWYEKNEEWHCNGFLMNTKRDSKEVSVIITP
jgi:proteasome lid subunit RPN8/RPN11